MEELIRGDGYLLMRGDGRRLINCPAVKKFVAGRRVAIITDPPYGVKWKTPSGFKGKRRATSFYGEGAGIKNDDGPPDVRFLLETAEDVIIWGGNYFADQLPPKPSWIVWDKRGGRREFHGKFDQAYCELAWCSDGRPARIHAQIWCGLVKEHCPTERVRVHPTQKPIALMEFCIRRFQTAEIILDPYMGSGTTGVAALRQGRAFIGIEIDKRFFCISAQRIKDEYKRLTEEPKLNLR